MTTAGASTELPAAATDLPPRVTTAKATRTSLDPAGQWGRGGGAATSAAARLLVASVPLRVYASSGSADGEGLSSPAGAVRVCATAKMSTSVARKR